MKNHKKELVWGMVILLIAVAGIMKIKQARNNEAKLPPASIYAIVVKTMKPTEKAVQLTLPSLALTKNDKDVVLSSRIAARVEWIKASGSLVKKGEVIAKLDNTGVVSGINSVKSQIAAQQTALKNLESAHRRTLELLHVQGATIEQSQTEESKIAALKSQIESLKQKWNDLKNSLTYANIQSPVDGRISATMVNKGDMAMPGRPVAGISANNGFFLLLRVPTGLKVYGVVLDGKNYPAIPLHSTYNSLAEYKVYVDSGRLTTGNRVAVNVIVYKGTGLALPFDAILNRNGKSYVMVQQGHRAVPEEIHEVQSGVEGVVVANADLEGKKVVVAKQDILLRLLGGTSLKVEEE